MASIDWRDALGALASQLPEGTDIPTDDTPAGRPSVQRTPVHIVLERKGRGGKTATIICDLDLDDDALKELAAELKRSLGCGGSARSGEILIQGDRVADCRRLLTAKGYKVK